MRKRWYVGHNSKIKKPFRGHEPFSSEEKPTEKSHGHKYNTVTGPFKTKGGAYAFAYHRSIGNPHITSVAQAERAAKEDWKDE